MSEPPVAPSAAGDLARHQRWTQTDIVELRRRLGDGEALPAIAEAMGRREEHVKMISMRLGLKVRALR